MALPILDGNQSATTLSTILSSGQHITAHTVVSLGTQAITDIVNATSAGLTNTQLRASAVTVGGTVTVGNSVTISSLPAISGTVTVGQIQGYKHASTATNGPFNADVMLVGEDIEAAYAAGLVVIPAARGGGVLGGRSGQGDTPICVYGDNGSAVTISGTVTVGNTVTISSLPAISGTVTANIGLNVAQSLIGGVSETNPPAAVRIGWCSEENFNGVGVDNGGLPLPIQIYLGDTSNNRVTTANPLPISGTVTAGNLPIYNETDTIIDGNVVGSIVFNVNGANAFGASGITVGSIPSLPAGTNSIGSVTASISNSVTIASLPAISGTVTANSSNGSLTTRFGSVTTANTAFATSAVTNANRKYLLIQNVTTASNVITVGIGFTPTTTQGIQLSSGAGLTFEGSYIPTGAVNLLSSVTASCFTILEA